MVGHLHHLALARPKPLNHGADKVLRNVDGQLFGRLHQRAIDALGDDLRPRNHQLKAFAAHHLDQHGKLQLAAAQHLEGLRVSPCLPRECETLVSSSLSSRSFRLREVTYWPSRPANGRVVHRELHRNRRLVDGDQRQRCGVLDVGERLADRDARNAGNRDDIAERGLGDVGALEAIEAEQLGDLDVLQRAVALGNGDLLPVAQRAVEDARNGQPAKVVGVVEVRDQDLQRAFRIALR